MPISYIYVGEPMIGSGNDDFVIAYKGSTGTDSNTVNAGEGDDWVFGDSSDTWIPNASYLNGSIATAFNLETLTSPWTTAENQMFGDWTTPHTTAIVEATIGQSEYFRVAIGAGQTITVDIDFASGWAIGLGRDLVVELQDSLGNIIATADDSLVSDGGDGSRSSTSGSASSYDPFLTFTVPTGGVYFINVRPFGGGPGSTFTENNTFVLNVSVTGHAVAASNPVQGADTINGDGGDDALFGAGGGDIINGGAGADFIDSGSGADIVHGDAGDDILYGGEGTEENLHGDEGNDTLFSGGEGHYYGDGGDDIIHAGLTAGVNEVLDGGADIDTLDTTTWNGAYVVNLVTGATNFGEIFINFENVVTGNGADEITGTGGANIVRTQGGDDIVNAGGGNDVVAGGGGGDTLNGEAGLDILDYRTSSGAVTVDLVASTATGGDATGDVISNFEGVWGSVLGDTLTGNGANNELRGFSGADTLIGGNGNDILDGGVNNDTMTGGLGDDTYFVDSASDVFTELAGEGVDTLAIGFTYSIAANTAFENLRALDFAATTAINLTGNGLANQITGNAGVNQLAGGAGNDILDGGLGADRLTGGLGDDLLIVDDAGDLTIEIAGQGNDTVEAWVSFSIAGRDIETLKLMGTALNGTGNVLDNLIIGNGLGNILNGGAGADTLQGGLGDDTYVVDNAGDVVTELNAQGTDIVQSSLTYTLGVFVENLTLTGAAAIDGAGNSLANTLVGNSAANTLDGAGGNDRLDGGLGDDILIGGLGNDTYVVNAAGDVITELAGQGTDKVEAAVSYSLSANIEELTLMGVTNINGTGNALVNKLYGNAGKNVLDGQAGADLMYGGLGDDTYIVDNASDKTYELAGEGNDTVRTSITFSIGTQEIETVILTGAAAIDGVGNGGANAIIGNDANNTLTGAGGDDRLNGGLGNDVLIGGAGLDEYWFDTALGAGNVDTLTGFNVADDSIHLDRTIFSGITSNGTLPSLRFWQGAAAHDADDRIIYDKPTGRLYYDPDGTGAAAQVLFAQLTANTALTNVDIITHN